MSDETQEANWLTVGCGALLALVVIAGLAMSTVSPITQPTDEEMLRACAEACGPGRLASYESLGNDCNCTEGP